MATTGIITVTTASTIVQGPNDPTSLSGAGHYSGGGFLLTAHPSNTGNVWVFDYGPGNITTGYPLAVGQQAFVPVLNLNVLGFDADTSGNRVCWMKE